jgi:hypothetical protein
MTAGVPLSFRINVDTMGIPPSTTELLLNTINKLPGIFKQPATAMENVQEGGSQKVNLNSPVVQRAIGSSVRIVSQQLDNEPSSNASSRAETNRPGRAY